MKFGFNNGRGWAARLTFAALALATTLVWGASVSAFEVAPPTFNDVDGNVAFEGKVDCERTAASVKEGAEKPTTVFWTWRGLNGSYPYAALSEEAKAAVDQRLAERTTIVAIAKEPTFRDADGNVAFEGDVDCERTAASVKEGAEKPTTVFWTNGVREGAYPYAALSEASKADVDKILAKHAVEKERKELAAKQKENFAAKLKENWSKASTLPLGFDCVQGDRFALVVGCGDDNADGANSSSAADARLLGERLRECGFEVVLLTGQEATRSNIEGALKTLEEKTKADDMIFVAFSGFGLERNGEIYCLPTEVLNLPANDVFKEVEEKCVSLSDFAQDLEKRTPGRRKAFFFDLCRGRGKDDVVDGAASLPANALTLCACASGESARNADFDGKEHGIFSYYFAEGLTAGDANGDDVVTLMEAFLYARAHSLAATALISTGALPNCGPVAYGPWADVEMRDLNAAPQETSQSSVPEVRFKVRFDK